MQCCGYLAHLVNTDVLNVYYSLLIQVLRKLLVYLVLMMDIKGVVLLRTASSALILLSPR